MSESAFQRVLDTDDVFFDTINKHARKAWLAISPGLLDLVPEDTNMLSLSYFRPIIPDTGTYEERIDMQDLEKFISMHSIQVVKLYVSYAEKPTEQELENVLNILRLCAPTVHTLELGSNFRESAVDILGVIGATRFPVLEYACMLVQPVRPVRPDRYFHMTRKQFPLLKGIVWGDPVRRMFIRLIKSEDMQGCQVLNAGPLYDRKRYEKPVEEWTRELDTSFTSQSPPIYRTEGQLITDLDRGGGKPFRTVGEAVLHRRPRLMWTKHGNRPLCSRCGLLAV